MKKVGLFEAIDSDDREGLCAQAFTAAKGLKTFSIIGLIVMGIASLYLMLLFANSLYVGNKFGKSFSSILYYNNDLLSLLTVLLIAFTAQAFILIYIQSIMKKYKNEQSPNLVISYIIIALNIYTFLKTLLSEITLTKIIILIIFLFKLYLWFLVIKNTKKSKSLSDLY